LSRLIIALHDGAPIYRHVGVELQVQFGMNPVGRSVPQTLSGEYAIYVVDIIESALRSGAPIFSSCVLHSHGMVKLTGRLMAPFTYRGAAAPSLIMSAHLVGGDDFKVTEVVEPGSVVETERLMIAGVPDLCSRLEEAGRYHRLSHLMADRLLASKWDGIAASLGNGILVPLGAYRTA
jgi:hypothetical protein